MIQTEDRPDLVVVGIYRSPKVPISHLLAALRTVLNENSSSQNEIIGDLNVNWLIETERQPLFNLMIIENNYKQLISSFTTDNRTLIDHLFTNLDVKEISAGVLETYFSDHKAIWASVKAKK